MSRGANPNPENSHGDGTLRIALTNQDYGSIDALLKAGANPNAIYTRGRGGVCLTALGSAMMPKDDSRKPDQRAAFMFIKGGGLYDPEQPEFNADIIKHIATNTPYVHKGYYQAGRNRNPGENIGVALFDSMWKELSNLGTKLSRRLPAQQYNNSEFIAFSEVFSLAHRLASEVDTQHPRQVSLIFADMLERTEGKWEDAREKLSPYSTADCIGFKDVVKGFYESVVLPEIIQRTRSKANEINYDKVAEQILPKLAQVIIGDSSMSTVLEKSRAWHHDLPVLEKKIRKLPRVGQWLPLADNFTASNGLTITFLTNAEALEDESRRLNCKV